MTTSTSRCPCYPACFAKRLRGYRSLGYAKARPQPVSEKSTTTSFSAATGRKLTAKTMDGVVPVGSTNSLLRREPVDDGERGNWSGQQVVVVSDQRGAQFQRGSRYHQVDSRRGLARAARSSLRRAKCSAVANVKGTIWNRLDPPENHFSILFGREDRPLRRGVRRPRWSWWPSGCARRRRSRRSRTRLTVQRVHEGIGVEQIDHRRGGSRPSSRRNSCMTRKISSVLSPTHGQRRPERPRRPLGARPPPPHATPPQDHRRAHGQNAAGRGATRRLLRPRSLAGYAAEVPRSLHHNRTMAPGQNHPLAGSAAAHRPSPSRSHARSESRPTQSRRGH